MPHFLGIPTEKSLEALHFKNKCLAFPASYVSINIFQVVHEEQELLKNHKAKIFFSDLKWSDKAKLSCSDTALQGF